MLRTVLSLGGSPVRYCRGLRRVPFQCFFQAKNFKAAGSSLRSPFFADPRSSSGVLQSAHGVSLGSLWGKEAELEYRRRKLQAVQAPSNREVAMEQSGVMQQSILVAGGLVAFVFTFKPIYEKYIRRDVSVSPAAKPVLAKMKRPTHASHRGGSRIWPENTMLAFRNAVESIDENGIKRRTHMLEFDIQKTKDGQLVIMHNETVEATTNGEGPLSSFTFEEIRKLDAGHCFTLDGGQTFPFRGKGLQVPSLREVLSEFVPVEGLIFYLDFKHPEAVADTMKLVHEFGIQERVVCGAIPAAANREMLRLKPACAPATPDRNSMIMLYVFYLLGLLWLVPMRHEIVGTTAYRFGMRVLTSRMVRAFQKRDRLMAVFGDHLDSKEGQLDCLTLGCDILVTDRPDLLHATMEQWSGKDISE